MDGQSLNDDRERRLNPDIPYEGIAQLGGGQKVIERFFAQDKLNAQLVFGRVGVQGAVSQDQPFLFGF